VSQSINQLLFRIFNEETVGGFSKSVLENPAFQLEKIEADLEEQKIGDRPHFMLLFPNARTISHYLKCLIFWSVKMSGTIVKETTRVKLDKVAKEQAKDIFNQLGLTMGEAFNLFLYHVNLNKELPFEVKLPNKLTQKVIEEARQGKNIDDFSTSELK
jgi:DNA-damage-inducible protein J